MSTKRLKSAIWLAAAALLILFATYFARRQESSTAAQNMPRMEMPRPTEAGAAAGKARPQYAEVSIPLDVQQRIGVTLGEVKETPLAMTIRTVGIVNPDETKVDHVHLKTDGWVDRLFISYTGQYVKAGDPLLSIYSPAFFAAEREFLTALRAVRSGVNTTDQQTVLETTRKRLELWGVPSEEIKRLETTLKPLTSLILRSPISGTVLEKKAFEGQYVTANNDLYVVADLSDIWVQGKVYEYELPHVELGMPVTVTFPSLPLRQFSGKIMFVDPVVEEKSRTARVRVELHNPEGRLKPGMFANMLISHAMGTGLTVPTSAVIRTGEQDIAFLAVSADRFVPVQLKISPLRFEERFHILEGLKAGDKIVTSANFLIDSESQLQAGGGGMAGMAGMSMGEKGKKPAETPHGMPGMPEKQGPTEKPDHSMMRQ